MLISNADVARNNMIEQQIRPWDVLDLRVLDLLRRVKREQFVPAEKQPLALMDIEIPLGNGAFMWQPKMEARVIQELNVRGGDHVLEVGTGSGYLTALLSRLASHVTSVEIVPELHEMAKRNLAANHIDNVTLELGDAAQGWQGNYDVIVLTGSVPVLPQVFLDALKPGGRLFAIVGDAPAMQATLVTCVEKGVYRHDVLFETSAPPLRNAMQPERFEF